MDDLASSRALEGIPVPPTVPAGQVAVTLDVNGTAIRVTIDARATLVDVLRDHLRLTGTKKGCALGQCGSCTVLVDGRATNACLAFAARMEGRRIETIEGLAPDGELHPVQAAFVAHDAFQCGYCTPGQIMATVALLSEGRDLTDDDIRTGLSGNLCRCGAYDHIRAAAKAAVAAGGEG